MWHEAINPGSIMWHVDERDPFFDEMYLVLSTTKWISDTTRSIRLMSLQTGECFELEHAFIADLVKCGRVRFGL